MNILAERGNLIPDDWASRLPNAYLKASHTGSFGSSVSLSADGRSLAIGAATESSGAAG